MRGTIQQIIKFIIVYSYSNPLKKFLDRVLVKTQVFMLTFKIIDALPFIQKMNVQETFNHVEYLWLKLIIVQTNYF